MENAKIVYTAGSGREYEGILLEELEKEYVKIRLDVDRKVYRVHASYIKVMNTDK